jgi:Phosphoglycerol transferase and related proteins, alkaline phosphatase superfamily
MHSFISEAVTLSDIGTALYYGLRISLKSVGLLVLLSLVCCSGLRLFVRSEKLGRIRFYMGAAYVVILSILFHIRLPYYQEFHMAFNQLLFNTFHDDVGAIAYTIIEQYNPLVRTLLAAVTALLLCKLLRRFLASKTYTFPRLPKWYQNIALRAVLLVCIYYLAIFIRYGGTMTYAYNIDWENSGVTRDQLLNEAILDDMQALYRAYTLHERVVSSVGLYMDPKNLAEYGSYLAGRKVQSSQLDDYLRKRVVIGQESPPRQVFLIIAESYANWPLLPQYSKLNIANGLKSIIAQEDAAYSPNFLPNGMSTISAVMGITTGMADANLYLNYLPESYKEPYSTSLAPQMKRLGYTADFWYAGPASWEKVRDFTLAQGFDAFYGLGDFERSGGNVWGCDDADLYKAILDHVKDDRPGLHVVLTVSNHSPFTVDLAKEGFDPNMVTAALPEKAKNDPELVKKLGHFWYADKMLAQFVKDARRRYPDSLFIIVGDHADRLNIDPSPSLYERYAIPFVVYGKGINKESLPEQTAGSQINITPTLMELIAPQDFEYYSVGRSLTTGNDVGINYGFWITSGYIGEADGDYSETHSPRQGLQPPGPAKIRLEVDAARAVSWWRGKYGKTLQNITAD